MSVNFEIHSSEVHLDDAGAEVSHLPNGVGLHGSLSVLYHNHAVLVIGIGDGESRLGQSVEESLLGIAIVLEGLVIIEVIASEVGEDSTREFQSADTFLSDGVAGAFHEGILASSLYHLAQKHVQFDGIRRGVVSGNCFAVDIVDDSREQTALISHLAEHII